MDNYLNLYVNSIKLNDKVKYHLDKTNILLDSYLSSIVSYNDGEDYYAYKNDKYFKLFIGYPKRDVTDCLGSKELSKENLLDVHGFIMEREKDKSKTTDSVYRKSIVAVCNKDKIIYVAPNPEEVDGLLDEFMDIYNNGVSQFSNPLIEGSLIHLLLVRIHPFKDGNGRVARLLQEIKFTESINEYYNSSLKLTPIDISEDTVINKIKYGQTLNNISFSLNDNSNINEWFDFNIGLYENKINSAMKDIKEENMYYKICDDRLKLMKKIKR